MEALTLFLLTAQSYRNFKNSSVQATSLSCDEETEPVMLVTPSASLDAHLQRVIEVAWNPHKVEYSARIFTGVVQKCVFDDSNER